MPLIVTGFGGGVVAFGSADTQRTDEIQRGDSVDIGPRGSLIVTTEPSAYVTLLDGSVPQVAWNRLYGILSAAGVNFTQVIPVGEGILLGANAYLTNQLARQGSATPLTGNLQSLAPWAGAAVPVAEGAVVTGAEFAGLQNVKYLGISNQSITTYFLNLGAREGYPVNHSTAFGLYAMSGIPPATVLTAVHIEQYDALGTGAWGELPYGGGAAGTKAQPLYFRGIIAYNNHLFGWGFDSAGGATLDGPGRVMFSNLGLPVKWGNDNQAAVGTDRNFTDSDAIVLGDAGEMIRGAIKWGTKLWFGTNRALHFIAGYGRDSFVSDGATPVARSFNIVGPNAMIEGPDRLLYGVSDQGLWVFDGATFNPIFRRVTDFDGSSPGYWNCIWTDPSRPANYPGRTNQDLVWTAVDWDREQVLIGIPWCNATSGTGYGSDTVVVKYHPRTGGFTRQVFFGVCYTAQGYFRREVQQPPVKLLGSGGPPVNLWRYGYQSSPTVSPALPGTPLTVVFGPYAPFGPDGAGVVRRAYLTVSWETLPVVLRVTTTVDASAADDYAIYIQPTVPGAAVGDYWLDTSQTSTDMGNATAGATIPARGGFLLKTLSSAGTWRLVPGQGGSGTRATIPLPLARVPGTRVTIGVAQQSAAGRYQLETLGMEPGSGDAAT